jgi:RimJ/RimL family protein N-acetyltransferase
MADSEILLAWRNDPATRGASHDESEVTIEQHERWLEAVLRDPNRLLYIAERDGAPVGTVRADFDPSDESHELSWTVSPGARAHGLGKEMVGVLANQIAGAIRAEVKVGNVASARIAEHCGMKLEYERDRVMFYRRPRTRMGE